jgi:hypothetical protein
LQTSSRHLQTAETNEVGRETRSLNFRRAKDLPGCRTTSDSRPQTAPKIHDGLVTAEENDDGCSTFAGLILRLRLKAASLPPLFEFNSPTKLHSLDANN